MKLILDFHESPVYIKDFILTWKRKKGYKENTTLSIGHCIELLIALSYNLFEEDSDGRFFNKMIKNNESVIGWEGEELIDILFYEVVDTINNRFKPLKTYSEPVVATNQNEIAS